MSWGRVVVLDSELSAEIPKLKIVDLFPIVAQRQTKLRTFCSVIVAKGSASTHLVK